MPSTALVTAAGGEIGRVPLAPVAPAARAQSGADVAAAVSFLCSPAARHTTGQAIDVDGGAILVRTPR